MKICKWTNLLPGEGARDAYVSKRRQVGFLDQTMFGWWQVFLRDDRKCNIRELPPPKMPFPLAVYFSELHCHAIYICKLSVRSCLCKCVEVSDDMLVSSRGGNVGTNTQRRRRRVKGGKSNLGREILRRSCHQCGCCAEEDGGCLTSRVTPDPTHVPGSIW